MILLINYTRSTALIQPSSSGLLVTCAYFPHTTFPDCVTRPSSLTFTSITVPISDENDNDNDNNNNNDDELNKHQ